MKKIKAAIIGCGLIAQERHIPAMTKIKNLDLVAVCDINEKLAKDVAKTYKIPRVYTESSKMFKEENLDLVDICVPPQIHANIAIEAMENSCHIIMEKPMALTVSDCDRMIESSEENNVKICVIHNKNFHKPFIKAKEMVKNGSIGDIIGMRMFLSTPRWDMIDLEDHWYHKLPGGVIGETGPHIAYMSAEFIKDITNAEVFAKNILNHPWTHNDEFRIELEGKNAISSIELTYSANYWVCDIEIVGTDALLRLDLNGMILTKHSLKELKLIPLAKFYLSNVSQILRGVLSNVFGSRKIGTEVVIEQFVESIKNNSEPPVTGEEGREAVRIMEMIVENYNDKYGLN